MNNTLRGPESAPAAAPAAPAHLPAGVEAAGEQREAVGNVLRVSETPTAGTREEAGSAGAARPVAQAQQAKKDERVKVDALPQPQAVAKLQSLFTIRIAQLLARTQVQAATAGRRWSARGLAVDVQRIRGMRAQLPRLARQPVEALQALADKYLNVK